jgi:hypothetical protein
MKLVDRAYSIPDREAIQDRRELLQRRRACWRAPRRER